MEKKNGKKRLAILGCLILGAGLLIALGASVAMGFDYSPFFTPKSDPQNRETHSFTSENITSVEIEGGFSRLRVESDPSLDAPELTMDVERISYQVNGETLCIKEESTEWKWYQLFRFGSFDDSLTVLRLPREFAGGVFIETGFGDVTVEGMSGLSVLRANSHNGAVRISETTVSGTMELESHFGAIRLRDCGGEVLSVNCPNGNVTAENCTFTEGGFQLAFGALHLENGLFQKVKVDNRNGDSTVKAVQAEEKFTYEASFGALLFDNLASRDIRLSSANGDVRGTIEGAQEDYQITCNVKFGQSNLNSGGSGKYKIQVESKFGDVKVEFTEG